MWEEQAERVQAEPRIKKGGLAITTALNKLRNDADKGRPLPPLPSIDSQVEALAKQLAARNAQWQLDTASLARPPRADGVKRPKTFLFTAYHVAIMDEMIAVVSAEGIKAFGKEGSLFKHPGYMARVQVPFRHLTSGERVVIPYGRWLRSLRRW